VNVLMNDQWKEEKKAEKAKLTAIEKAMLNGTPNDVVKLYREFHIPLLTARILGIAGRYCGLDMVKALVESGASFEYEEARRTQEVYHFISYYYTYHYSMVLSDFFILFLLKGVDRIKGYTPIRKMNALVDKEGKPLVPVSEAERIQIIEYLCDQEQKVCIQPGDFLYFAILTEQKNIVDALKNKGIRLSEERRKLLVEEGGRDNDLELRDRWIMYYTLLEELDDDAFMRVTAALCMEIGEGKKLFFTEILWKTNHQRFFDPVFFASLLEHFNQSKMNKKKILTDIIDNERVSCLEIVENHGWLKDTHRRDELIEYALENGRTESTAWLLNFKNRTADLAAERQKVEKKLMRELNMAPDCVTALRKIWSYEKREDGTLSITRYKGEAVEVIVPEKIGKNIVTVIGDRAFMGDTHHKNRAEQQHCKITKITLPHTIQQIRIGAFSTMPALKEIDIPDGVNEIGQAAFWECTSLQSITIPGSVKKIGAYAFLGCTRLKSVHICEGVIEIGEYAFSKCRNLEKVVIPNSVQELSTCPHETYKSLYEGKEVFGGCPKLVIHCPKGSKAEAYCKEKGYLFLCDIEEKS